VDTHVFEDPGAWYRTLVSQAPGCTVTSYDDPKTRRVGFLVEKDGAPPQALLLGMKGWAAHPSHWTWSDTFPRHRVWHGFWADAPPELRDLIRTPVGRRNLAEQLAAPQL
jgi:hypothetical protein